MQRKIEILSLLVTLPVSILGFVLFKDKNVLVGVWIGALAALMGFRMIIQMTSHLNPNGESAKKQGYVGYVLRYFMYGVVLFLSAYVGVPVLSVLAGMMCHKASLLIYSAIGKEDE